MCNGEDMDKTKVGLQLKWDGSSEHTGTRFRMFLALEFWVAPAEMSTINLTFNHVSLTHFSFITEFVKTQTIILNI